MDILQGLVSRKMDALNIEQAIDYAVKVHKEELEDLNTMQLDQGLDMEGKSLGGYKSIAYKGRINPVDLKKSGDWRKSQKVTSKNGVIDMTATNWKTRVLIEGEGRQRGYGEDILGLPKKDIDSGEVGKILLDSIIVEVKRQITNVQ